MAQRKKRTKKTNERAESRIVLTDATQQGLLVIGLFAFAALLFLSFIDSAGILGTWVDYLVGRVVGFAKYVLLPLSIGFGYVFLHPDRYTVTKMNYVGLVLFLLSTTGLLHLFIPLHEIGNAASQGKGGGYLGIVLSYPLVQFADIWMTTIFLVGMIIGSLLLLCSISISRALEYLQFLQKGSSFIRDGIENLFSKIQEKKEKIQEKQEKEISSDDEYVQEVEYDTPQGFAEKSIDDDTTQEVIEQQTEDPEQLTFVPKTKKKKHKKIDLPISLLVSTSEKATSGNIELNKEKIQRTLESFNIDVEMGEVSVGPMVTQYTLRPSEGVKLNQITTLHNDISLALAAHPIRIEAPIPGKSLVGIEIPNETSATVSLKELLAAKSFKDRKDNLALCLGRDVSGQPTYKSVARMPHLLIAGATGSGKSVCINGIITSLLYQNTPETLRFIMVDPKRVELTVYNGIPHLLTPVITEVEKTINALKWTVSEMDRRYEKLARVGKRNIESFNESVEEDQQLPYIIFVIDELADLMSVAASSVEAAIVRLAQMSRAVGIHLILATQRPSVNVITGLIKANMPARIAFSVTSLVDSRTILDFSGAEKLIGRGDMLYLDSETSKPKRIQGAYLSDHEIENVVSYLREQEEEVEYNHDIVESSVPSSSIPGISGGSSDTDDLLPEAKESILQAGKASASLLQRRLRIGYARAARILDILEEEGFIGPAEGAKPREILQSQESAQEETDDTEPLNMYEESENTYSDETQEEKEKYQE